MTKWTPQSNMIEDSFQLSTCHYEKRKNHFNLKQMRGCLKTTLSSKSKRHERGWKSQLWWRERLYSKVTYSVDSLNFKYLCHRWSYSHVVFHIEFQILNSKSNGENPVKLGCIVLKKSARKSVYRISDFAVTCVLCIDSVPSHCLVVTFWEIFWEQVLIS